MDFIIGMDYNVNCKNLSPVDGAIGSVTYTGQVVPSTKYDPPNTIRMTTDIEDFPFRVIPMADIISVNDRTFCFQEMREKETTRIVKGSCGNEYVVRTMNGRSTCTCPGFQFRKTCKHIEG